ncbi:hypothetical protein DPMN_053864 [Dreissena polymorpha]|uniref:Uncharacterized protein n=1 Tax=Dreissena polymorpha TaxID=45954 RepID=A0A9D4HSL2_DREPO|nr:hypothetical protein DPMN_053864 [Dreissena polymorpha]
MQEIPRLSAMVPDSLPERRAHARESHTFCDVPRPSGQLQVTPRQSVTVPNGLSLRRRLFWNLLQVHIRSWHRRRLSGSLLQLPAGLRDCLAPSQTVWVSPLGAPTVWQTVLHFLGVFCRCPNGLVTVVDCLGVSYRCAAGLGYWHRRTLSGSLLQVPRRSLRLSGTVSDCLRVSFRCPDGLADCLALFGCLLQMVLAPLLTVLESPAGAQLVWETF